MSERIIVSPGVFIREQDKSFLPQGISQIGAAIIGPTSKGPAFMPTLIESYDDFVTKFGAPDGTSYVPYAVKGYMKNSSKATIVRVTGLNGYQSDAIALTVSCSISGSSAGFNKVVAVLAPNDSTKSLAAVTASNFNTSSLTFTITSASVVYTASLISSNANYIGNVFNSEPNTSSSNILYLYSNFPEIQNQLYSGTTSIIQTGASASFTTNYVNTALNLTASKMDTTSGYAYMEAETPYIQSQDISGTKYNLFKFVTFNAGKPDIKVSISDVKYASEIPNATYGTFNVLVRDINDTDKRPIILEQFTNVSLDPTANNYIARVIGDQYRILDGGKIVEYGDNPNRSKYIRVEMSTIPAPTVCVPLGFGSYNFPLSGSANAYKFADLSFVTSQYDNGLWNTKKYLGFDFTYTSNLHVLKPKVVTPVTSSTFSLESTTVASASTSASYSQTLTTYTNRKFTLAFMGGFDGIDPTMPKYMGTDITETNVMGFDLSTNANEGTIAYKKAIDAVSNPDEFDINMIITPGILYQKHSLVCDHADDMCNSRGDAFYIMDDVALNASVSDAVNTVAGLDTSFSAVYYPWVKILDSDNNKYMWVPPSVVMAGVVAFSDKVGAEWWAPAGLNRGGVDATQVYTRLTEDERNTLYLGRVNPIASFTGHGIAVWGQKTLQLKPSAKDRVNVRRLLIALNKYVASTSKYLVFENNTVQTREAFINMVTPYLRSVKNRQGLYAFEIVMDETNNTPDVIDRNQLLGKIYIQPSKAAEFVIIDFNVTRTGASFVEN